MIKIPVTWVFFILVASGSLIHNNAFHIFSSTPRCRRCRFPLKLSKHSPEETQVHIEVIASAGLTSSELSFVLSTAKSAVDNQFGIKFLSENMSNDVNPVLPKSIPGVLGRVLLLSLNNVADDWDDNDSRLDPFKNLISQEIDALVGDQIEQPVLVSVNPNIKIDEKSNLAKVLNSIIENEVMMYDLRTPMIPDTYKHEKEILPNIHVEIDGAMVPDPYSKEEFWDTSTIMVYDDFVDSKLRERLLDVVNKRDENNIWNDKINGPNPARWERGGLMDTFADDGRPTCWGLTDEAINELCFDQHSAISDVEAKICALFSNFVVTRLPEAVMGACVSPLTANAPTFGDKFSYHIDADPNQTPPSPWTDIFGRYFNRVRGKPRFVSCLIYLNDEWNEDFGAPTQFYDPPTNEVYKLFPRPGRCVIMDQDVTHTVVAPNKIAGTLPRYSLVWKLILHPKKERQSMKFTASESLQRIGSANHNH